MIEKGYAGATTLLAGAFVAASLEHDTVAGDDFEAVPGGISAVVCMPSGDRYRVTVEWIGDNEAERGTAT